MSEEKMRSEFEAAAEEHFWLQDLRRDYDKAEQEYLDEIVQTAWEFWKFSREALQAECEQLRKDAERYRWLREQHWSSGEMGVLTRPRENARLGAWLPSKDLLDEAIDAAMVGGDQ